MRTDAEHGRFADAGGAAAQNRNNPGWQDPGGLGLYAAEVLHASARDFYGGAGQWYEEKITVHLRTPRTYSPAPGLRVLWQGRAYDVLEVTPDKPLRGITELRAAAAEMEGSGCQA